MEHKSNVEMSHTDELRQLSSEVRVKDIIFDQTYTYVTSKINFILNVINITFENTHNKITNKKVFWKKNS